MAFGHAHPDIHSLLEGAAAFLESGQLAECIRLTQAVLKIDPHHGPATHLLGIVSHRLRDLKRAERLLRQALKLGVDSPECYSDLGRVLIDQSRWDEASHCFEHAIARFPQSPIAFIDLGYLQNACGAFNQAAKVYQDGLSRFPLNLELWTNLATLHRERGNLQVAIDMYDEMERLFGVSPSIREARGRALLQKQDWQRGWDDYEARLAIEGPTAVRFDPDIRRWDGEPLEGKRVVVLCEQGIGDEVQFASCYPDLIRRCRRCTLTCSPRLQPVFIRSFPEADVVPLTAEQRMSPLPRQSESYDFQVAAGSLPRFLRTRSTDFPQSAYLCASPQKRERFRLEGRSLRVGISWWGGSIVSQIKQRSIAFELFSQLLAIPGAEFVNLQHGRCDEASVALGLQSFHNLTTYTSINPYVDIDTWLALIASLDLVITVDNSNAHFAGALGIQTWLLLAEKPNWRWPYEVDMSQWYPDVTFFRQSAAGDWTSVLQQVAKRLIDRVRQRD